jgi:hypothetical protein
MTGVDPTELVAGAWQLRPWPAAYADLDDVLREQGFHGADLPLERQARLDGWSRGDLLGFAVRAITTGESVGEVVVRVEGASAAVEATPRMGCSAQPEAADAVRRWVTGALGLPVP